MKELESLSLEFKVVAIWCGKKIHAKLESFLAKENFGFVCVGFVPALAPPLPAPSPCPTLAPPPPTLSPSFSF